jgi:hypothetical protein
MKHSDLASQKIRNRTRYASFTETNMCCSGKQDVYRTNYTNSIAQLDVATVVLYSHAWVPAVISHNTLTLSGLSC